jgi:hypothetical protein
MMIALTRLDRVLRYEPAQMIATVHDEAVLLVPDDPAGVKRIGAIAQREMIEAFLEVFPDGPTLNLVDPRWGQHGATCSRYRAGWRCGQSNLRGQGQGE